MFRWLIITLLLSVPLAKGHAQAWSPYVPGQVSYFSGYDGDTNKILKREIKALYHRNGYSVAYFHDGFQSGCRADEITSSVWSLEMDSLVIDSFGFTYTLGDYSVSWPLHVPVGHSWRFPIYNPSPGAIDSIEVRYDSVGWGNFLGISDSIRYYTTVALKDGAIQSHPINTHGVQLSKHHGLVKMIELLPANYWLFGDPDVLYRTELVGLTSDTIQAGFQLPDIMDFFSFVPGDVLKWEKKETPYELMYGPEKTWIFRDSVLSVSATDTIVSYTLERSTQHPDGTITHGHIRQDWYERSYYQFLTDGLSMYMTGRNGYPMDPDVWLLDFINTNDNDVCLFGRFDGLNISQCRLEFIADAGASIRICRNQGIVFSSWSHSGGEITYRLLGRTSNTDTIGDIRPLGISLANPHTVVQLYPNPATESFYLSLPDNLSSPALVHITDMQGRVVHREQYRHGEQISIVHIAAGTYVVSVATQHWVAHLKLLKK